MQRRKWGVFRVLKSALSEWIFLIPPKWLERSFIPIFTGGKWKQVSCHHCGDWTTRGKDVSFIPHVSKQLDLPTCSLPGIQFSAHLAFPLISWQVCTGLDPFSVEMLAFTVESGGSHFCATSGFPPKYTEARYSAVLLLCHRLGMMGRPFSHRAGLFLFCGSWGSPA